MDTDYSKLPTECFDGILHSGISPSPSQSSSTCSLDSTGLFQDFNIRYGLSKIRSQVAASLERLKQLEKEVQIIPVLQVQISVLQEEKRQLINQLKSSHVLKKSQSCAELCHADFLSECHPSYQSFTQSLLSPSKHDSKGNSNTHFSDSRHNGKEVHEKRKKIRSIAKGRIEDYMVATKPISQKDESTRNEQPLIHFRTSELVHRSGSWKNVTDNSCDPIIINKRSVGVGDDLIQMYSIACGTESPSVRSIGVGIVRSFTYNTACGDHNAYALTDTKYVQTQSETKDNYTQIDRKVESSIGIIAKPETLSTGVGTDAKPSLSCDSCSFKATKSVAVQVSTLAPISLVDIGVGMCAVDDDIMWSEKFLLQGVQSVEEISESMYVFDNRSIGIGENSVDDTFCNHRDNIKLKSVGVGNHTLNDTFCQHCENRKTETVATDICFEVLPQVTTVGVGDCRTDDRYCEICDNVHKVSVASGECTTLESFLCEQCQNLQTINTACDDGSVNDKTWSDKCTNKEFFTKGVGICKISDNFCDKCDNLHTKTVGLDVCSEIFPVKVHIGVGDQRVDVHSCDKCFNLKTVSVGVGEDRIDEFELQYQNINWSLDLDTHGNKCVCVGERQSHMKIDYSEETLHQVQLDDMQMSHSQSSSELSTHTHDIRLDEQFLQALQKLNGHFFKNEELSHDQMMCCMSSIESHWFDYVGNEKMSKFVIDQLIHLITLMVPMLLDTIINLADENGNTAVHFAVSHQNFPVVDILIDSNVCNVDMPNKAGYTPLMLMSLVGTKHYSERTVVRKLFKIGDVNKSAIETGQTPLLLAASHSHIDIVELLLEAGADVNATDEDDSTALMCASEHGNSDIVKSLLAHPDCNACFEDRDGSTAMSIAMDKGYKSIALLIYAHINFKKSTPNDTSVI